MTYYLQLPQMQKMLDLLQTQFDTVLGPRVVDQVVLFRPVSGVGEFPTGYTVSQTPGRYRLDRDDSDPRIFSWVNGPQSLKSTLFPPSTVLLNMRRSGSGEISCHIPLPEKRIALIGARPCDVAAMQIQDRIFLKGDRADSWYQVQKKGLFVVAVNCVTSAENCFCTSMGSGPEAREGFEIALTEVLHDGHHFFTAVSGSQRGYDILQSLGARPASSEEQATARKAIEQCAATMKRSFDREAVKTKLLQGLLTDGWDTMAETCLACGNCTLVCPTCFCSNVVDSSALDGAESARTRKWDSCFSADHSYIHGGSIRKSLTSRYRQWISHKLATWYEQFKTPGCTGCGRCMTWCPVGIDLVKNATEFSPENGRGTHEDNQ